MTTKGKQNVSIRVWRETLNLLDALVKSDPRRPSRPQKLAWIIESVADDGNSPILNIPHKSKKRRK